MRSPKTKTPKIRRKTIREYLKGIIGELPTEVMTSNKYPNYHSATTKLQEKIFSTEKPSEWKSCDSVAILADGLAFRSLWKMNSAATAQKRHSPASGLVHQQNQL